MTIKNITDFKHHNRKYYINDIRIKKTDIIEYTCIECDKDCKISARSFHNLLCSSCKSKKTKLNKYGNKDYNNSTKMKETKLSKYGSSNGYSAIQKGVREKYGVNNVSELDFVKEKIGLKNKEKSQQALKKRKETNIIKWGHPYAFSYGTKEFNKNVSSKYNRIEINKRITIGRLFNSFDNLKNKLVTPLFTKNEYIQKQDKYEKFDWQCSKCNTIFKSYYENGIIPRCPTCYPKLSGYSNQEKEIVDYVNSFNSQVIENDRSIIKPYEIDIYLPEYNLAIEYNGLYWHSMKFIQDKWYHQRKVELAYREGIRLLHIWENGWLEDKDGVKQIIGYYIKNVDEYISVEKPKLYNIHGNKIWI